jgi:hypothetical protein
MGVIMADPSLRYHFQDLRNFIDDSIYRPWGVVFNKLGTAFSVAYKNHTESLPAYNVSTAGPDFFKDYVMAGAVAWLAWGGPQGLLLVPLVNGINLGVAHLNKRPRNVKIESPAIDLTPAEFQGSLKHVLDTAFIKILEFVDSCIRHSDGSQKIPLKTSNDMWTMLGLSPLSYLPKDWAEWNAREMADEFERQLWATWASDVADDVVRKKNSGTLGSYSYKKVITRLADVTRAQRDGQAEAFGRMAREQRDDADNHKLNIATFVKVRTWAVNYKPLMKFDHPLPGAVVKEMQRLLTFPADIDRLLLGKPLLRVY